MQQFMVPQFIDVESKILGPITARQFVLMIIGGAIGFITFRYANVGTFIIVALILVLLVFLFGFFKINGSPFHVFLINLTMTFKRPTLRVWNKSYLGDITEFSKFDKIDKNNKDIKHKKLVSSSRLAELSLVVDTRGKYQGE